MYTVYYNPQLWVSPKMGVPQNDGLQWKNLLKWMIWGVFPLFLETPLCRDYFIIAIKFSDPVTNQHASTESPRDQTGVF